MVDNIFIKIQFVRKYFCVSIDITHVVEIFDIEDLILFLKKSVLR